MSYSKTLDDFDVLTYNVRGLGYEPKRRKIFNYIEKNTSGKSIIFLQETHSTQKVENLWRYQWHGDMIFSRGMSGGRGVCVAFRYDLEYKMLSPEIVDKEGRFIILYIEIQGSQYIIYKLLWP